MPEPVQQTIRLSIGSRYENIELVQAVLDETLESLPIDEETSYWMGIALREALANAIKHGNGLDPEKKVDVCLAVDESGVDITVEDQGSGFDPGAVADPLAPDNLLKTEGRGIFYMRRFMDKIDYDFGADGGTKVRLHKKFGAPGISAEADQGGANED
ncbi:MAG: ATP-binding protein [Acidobacteriota bacterium]|nr:ATP-binding protein [Acidobacteriota bacterium]MDE2923441.1 ATP-binding protein [Acidobacteriota bacterium]MDE3263672.1 ATP-binding protein [Acidobacteriota bacterium]